jgi:hypothetical protein
MERDGDDGGLGNSTDDDDDNAFVAHSTASWVRGAIPLLAQAIADAPRVVCHEPPVAAYRAMLQSSLYRMP